MASSGRNLDYFGLKATWKADDLCVLNDDDVVQLLRAAVEREGSQSAFAKRYGVQRTELNAILNGRKPVTASFAKLLGFAFAGSTSPIRGDRLVIMRVGAKVGAALSRSAVSDLCSDRQAEPSSRRCSAAQASRMLSKDSCPYRE
jgi:hypothetical protein